MSHLIPTHEKLIQNCLKTGKSQKNKLDECDNILSIIGKRLKETNTNPEDKFDIIGKIWAYKLREVNNEQRIHAEKIINDVIYEAELGNLNRYCTLSVHTNESYFHTSTPIQPSARYQSHRPQFRQSFSLQEYPQRFQPEPNYLSYP